jgi:hypothetical protein
MVRTFVAAAVMAGLLGVSSCGVPTVVLPDPAATLFTAAPHDPSACRTERILRCRTVRVNFALLEGTRTPGAAVKINPFEDATLDAILAYNEPSDLGSDYRNWRGEVRGSEFSTVGLTFSTSRSRVTGTVYLPATYPRNYFTVGPIPGVSGAHVVEEIDPRGSPASR